MLRISRLVLGWTVLSLVACGLGACASQDPATSARQGVEPLNPLVLAKLNADANIRTGPGSYFPLVRDAHEGEPFFVIGARVNPVYAHASAIYDERGRAEAYRLIDESLGIDTTLSAEQYAKEITYYRWFEVSLVGHRTGWIWENNLTLSHSEFAQVYAPLRFDNDDAQLVALSELPAPSPPAAGLICVEGKEAGRLDCAAQVYYRYYYSFKRMKGHVPTLRNLLSAIYVGEFGMATANGIEEGLAVEALKNNFIGYTGDTRTIVQVIDWLGNVPSWYQLGDPTYATPATTPTTLDEGIPEHYFAYNARFLTLQRSGMAIQWGNYPYGGEAYNRIMNNLEPGVLACQLYQDSGAFQPYVGNPLLVTPARWTDEVFIIADRSISGIAIYDQSVDAKPAWAKEFRQREEFPQDAFRTPCHKK